MTFHFIYALIFNKDEITKEEILNTEFSDLPDGDYIDHVLIDKDNRKVIFKGDNTHNPIAIEIECFIRGIYYAGATIETEVGVFLTQERHNLKTAEFFKKPFEDDWTRPPKYNEEEVG